MSVALLGLRDMLGARSLANEARATIETSAELSETGDFDAARTELLAAIELLDEADARLESPWATVVGAVPLVSNEAGAASAGLVAVREGSLALVTMFDFLLAERPPLFSSGAIDPIAVELLDIARSTALEHTLEARRAIDEAPRARLDAIASALTEADEVTAALADVLAGSQPLIEQIGVAAGGGDPFRILVLFENGAELRATGGLMGVFALVEINGGNLAIASTSALGPRDPTGRFVSVEAPDDYMSRYGGFLANTTLWSNVNLSPDFPTVADIATRLYGGVTGIEPDMVARIDLVALGYLMEAFPGIVVEGAPLDADTLATDFLLASYERFSEDEQAVYVASVVADVFQQIVQGAAADRSSLASGLRRALRERRISLFMRDGDAEQLFERAGAAGRVLEGEPGDVEVVTQNFAANKVDIFTQTEVSIDIEDSGCLIEGELSITLENRTPPGVVLPAGGGLGNTGRWWVSFYLPANAVITDLFTDGAPAGGTSDVELGRQVASVLVRAEPGQSTKASITWQEQITHGEYRLRTQPQPMVNPAVLSIGGDEPKPFVETVTKAIPIECGS